MRGDKRTNRMREIEAEAYALFAEQGFEGTSMLAVAKRAKASNETLYRWYGDKHGMFESMVRANAEDVRAALEAAATAGDAPMDVLAAVAKALLGMLLSEKALVLNRAAASDPTGALGRLLAKAGRAEVVPVLQELMQNAVSSGDLGHPQAGNLAELFVRLLVGDQQIRRVIGVLDVPSPDAVHEQTTQAVAQLRMLCPPSP